jgi:hypothetical protein
VDAVGDLQLVSRSPVCAVGTIGGPVTLLDVQTKGVRPPDEHARAAYQQSSKDLAPHLRGVAIVDAAGADAIRAAVATLRP